MSISRSIIRSEGRKARPRQENEKRGRSRRGSTASITPARNYSGARLEGKTYPRSKLRVAGGEYGFQRGISVDFVLLGQLLVLLAVANGAPVVMTKLLKNRLSWPLDAGARFLDGRAAAWRIQDRSRTSVFAPANDACFALVGLTSVKSRIDCFTATFGAYGQLLPADN